MNYINWITANEMKDLSMGVRYLNSLYWAAVTCTTVGYGDILPMNKYELLWAVMIIACGVSVFSYILSDLSSKFSDLLRTKSVNQDKLNQIDVLNQKFGIGDDLMKELKQFFETFHSESQGESNREMSIILKALPSSLKTHMAKFIYQDALFLHTSL